jgi:histidyl-tRNA synthetase
MSGGRYDGLVGMFSGKDLPAIGISLGIDRLFSAIKEMDLLEDRSQPAEVLAVQFSEDLAPAAFEAAARLRRAGIATVIYPREAKMKKQLQFAQKAGIPFVVVIGEDEKSRGTIQLRDMEKGSQQEITIEEAIRVIGAEVSEETDQ